LLVIVLCFLYTTNFAQTEIGENSWLNYIVTLKKNKWAASFRVTERLNVDNKKVDINRHINSFTDVGISKSLPKNFKLKLLTRRFFNPKPVKDVSFIWVDLSHKFTYKTISLNNLLRHHWALNLYDINQADFIRYIPNIAFQYSKNSAIFVQADLFYRLNGFNQPVRIRYEAGIKHKLNKALSITVKYWREPSFNISPKTITNVYFFALAHNINL